ncbi:MAG: RES domain-containing protein, partial [Gammaproteobacteria bacterium]|nr:RES domain-containing protein [Gammaproteobacteria bacterium]
MNHARAGELPLIRLAQILWYRSVEERYQFEPPLAREHPTRFNPGNLQVMYFASDQVLARFEARDVLGHWFGDAVPSPRDRHVVVEYSIDLGPNPVVDARPPQLATVETTVQEMTGDWHSYPWGDEDAPTQELARAIHD